MAFWERIFNRNLLTVVASVTALTKAFTHLVFGFQGNGIHDRHLGGSQRSPLDLQAMARQPSPGLEPSTSSGMRTNRCIHPLLSMSFGLQIDSDSPQQHRLARWGERAGRAWSVCDAWECYRPASSLIKVERLKVTPALLTQIGIDGCAHVTDQFVCQSVDQSRRQSVMQSASFNLSSSQSTWLPTTQPTESSSQ